MKWNVEIKEEAIDHLIWFGKATGRELLQQARKRLEENPLAENKNMKSLRPNAVAQKELRLFGKYRVLFSVDIEAKLVTIILVGEKRGNKLVVSGEEFTAHESDSAE
jgi:mRNA-degrading endonuclease RelE of RelBE toxin-antitoxin system